MPPDVRQRCLRLLLIVVAWGAALGVCGVATGCAALAGTGAPGFFERVAGAVARGGENIQAAGAAIAPASPQVGAALLAIGGGMTTMGGYFGGLLLRRRLAGVPSAIVRSLAGPAPTSPSAPAAAAPPPGTIAPVDSVAPARVDTVTTQAGTPELASAKPKRKRARRRVAAAPFAARIAPALAGDQQTSGRHAA
jgi:hypothetical protein